MMRKTAKLFLAIFVVVFAASLAVTGCGKKDLVKVRLNEVTHSVFYAPMYIAMSQGFFEQEGIEIELTNGAGSDKVMTALLSGSADVGLLGPEAVIYVYNQGKEDYVQMFAQVTKRDGSFLLAREPDPGFTWDKVKGKYIIGGRKGGVPEMTLEYVLKKHRVIPGKDVHVDTSIQFALMAGAFKGGKGDFVTAFEPVASQLEKDGAGYIVASIGRDSGEIPYTGLAATKSYIQKNKDVIQKVTNALYRGQVWARNHTPVEIANEILKHFPDTDLEIMKTVAERYKKQDTWMETPVMKKEAFNRLQDVIREAGELKEEVPFDKVINNEFARTAVQNIK